MASSARDNSGFCTECHKAFHCDPWRYVRVVAIKEAKDLGVEELLAWTNPSLAERVQMKDLVASLGGDAHFAAARDQLEEMHSGELRSRLHEKLLNWERLGEDARTALAQQIADRARAWKFALHIAPSFPSHVGCLPGIVVGLVVWLVLFAAALAAPGPFMISGSFLLSFLAASLTGQFLLNPQIRRWTRNELIPECADAKVSFASFAEVVDDLTGSALDQLQPLWTVKLNLETIRRASNVARETQ